MKFLNRPLLSLGIAIGLGLGLTLPAQAWEPTKPIEFVVPAGTGGGADQMARFLQGVVAKNNLSTQPIIVVDGPYAIITIEYQVSGLCVIRLDD